MMNSSTAAEELVSSHPSHPAVVPPSTAGPVAEALRQPVQPHSEVNVPLPTTLSPPLSVLSISSHYSSLSVAPGVSQIPADSGNADDELNSEIESQHLLSETYSHRDIRMEGSLEASGAESVLWTTESVTAMLQSILDVRVKYDNGAGGFKQGIWRSIKEKLEAAGCVRSAKQIQNKFAGIKKRWHERRSLLLISGFGINPNTKRIEASDECWEDLKVSIISIL